MTRVQGSVPYPPGARSAPIRQFAGSLRALAGGLAESSGQLAAVGAGVRSAWTGGAADAFDRQLAGRTGTVQRAATSIAEAAPALDTYAAAIDATSTAYSTAASAEQAARAGLPWTAGALAAAIVAEQAAVAALVAAGSVCAAALMRVNAEVAAGLFAGVDRESFASIASGMTAIWSGVEHLTGAAPTTTSTTPTTTDADIRSATEQLDLAMWEMEARIDALAPTSGTARAEPMDAVSPTAGSRPERAEHAVRPAAGAAPTDGWGAEALLANDAIGTSASLAERIQAIQPRVGTIIDPATGQPVVTRGGTLVRPQSPIVDRFGNPIGHAGAATGTGHRAQVGRAGTSPIVDRFGNPVEFGRGGSALLDPSTGRPFAVDAAGRPVAGPRVVAVRQSPPGLGPAGARPVGSPTSVLQQLERIAGEVARMDVHLERPAAAPSTSGWQTAGRVLNVAGRAANVVGAAAGGWTIGRGIVEGDGYRIADGAINVGLAIAGALTLATPVGWALLAVGALWSVGSYLSGDIPLTRRIRDSAGRLADPAPRAASRARPTTAAPRPIAVTGTPQFVPAP